MSNSRASAAPRRVRRALHLGLVALCASSAGCAGSMANLPRASADASEPLLLEANQDADFFVDDKPVGRGRMLRLLVSDAPHRIVAKPDGYFAKEMNLQPPYDDGYGHRFTFLLEDRMAALGTAPPAPPAAMAAAPAVDSAPMVPQTSAPTAVPRIWTIAVGVSSYATSGMNLQFADRDALAVDEFFASPAGGSVPADHRVVLVNQGATRAAVLGALTSLVKRTASDDLLVVFLAMHGLPDAGGDLYYVVHDTDPRSLVGTGLPQRDIEYALARAPAKRMVLLIDACHAGAAGFASFAGKRGLALEATNRLVSQIAASKPGVALLSASSSTETSQESAQWGGGHGAFSHFVLDGLRGAADANRDGFVCVRELYDYVYSGVSTATAGDQHPELKGDFDNGLPLAQP